MSGTVVGHETHPAADIFPLLEGAAFDELCADIKAHGLREPIVRYWVGHEAAIGTRKPLILDGRNRLRACMRLGIQPVWRDYDGSDPLEFVLSANLHRRHLNESQRALVAAKLATLGVGRPVNTPIGVNTPTQSAAAKMLNVGQRTVQRAKQVIEAAPEMVPRIESGELTVWEAAKCAAENGNGQPSKEPPVTDPYEKQKASLAKANAPRSERRAERDVQIVKLVDEGYGTNEIARMLGVNSSTITHAKQRMGRQGSPLASLVSCADEFTDTWELALSNNKSLRSATPDQREELVDRLEALVRVTRKLIARLNKDAEESEMAS